MDINEFSDIVLKSQIFRYLTTKEFYDLFKSIDYKMIYVPKDIIIHKIDEICDNIIIILEGTLSINQCNYNNKHFNIYNLTSSDIIGANSVFARDNKYQFNIYTKTPCVLLYIPQKEVLNLCVNDRRFLELFLTHIGDKSQKHLNKIKILSNKNIRSSIKQFLNEEFLKQKSTKINLEISKKELAQLIGVERTSLSRELKYMKLDGLINYDKNSITLLSLKDDF